MPRIVRLEKKSTRWRTNWFIVFAITGLVSGAISRNARDSGPIHYEAIVSWAFLMVMSFVAMRLNRRQPRHSALIDFNLQAFFLWFAFLAGWSVVNESIWEDILLVLGAWWLGVALVGTLALVLLQKFYPPKFGPYCPGCGYYLVGLSQQICPECGRGFSIEELGISEEDLSQLPGAADNSAHD